MAAPSTRAEYYSALKSAGAVFDKPYNQYTTDEMSEMYQSQLGGQATTQRTPIPDAPVDREAAAFFGYDAPEEDVRLAPPAAPAAPARPELPGERANTHTEDDPVRTDPDGTVWYQLEVMKPATPKPRGRRVLRETSGRVVQSTVQDGRFTETFEIEGNVRDQSTEIKITLPSYQTGIYKAPNMPFKIHTYGGVRAFDMTDVNKFYGGPDLVPTDIKRVYVSNDLCYDMRTTIRAIQAEYREQQLAAGRSIR